MLVFTLLWALLWPFVARGESLERVDAVVRQARDLDDLLARPALVDEYFGALQKYYGETAFSREAFDAILTQLREAKEKVPGLKARLWETTGLGDAYSITTAVKTHGRTLAAPAWSRYREAWSDRLKEEAKVIYDLPEDLRLGGVRQVLAAAQKSVDDLERSIEERKLSARAAGTARRELFSGLRADPGLKAAMAYVTRHTLESERVRDLLASGDADLVLDTLRGYKQTPADFLDAKAGWPPLAHSLVREHIPELRELLARTDVFPVTMRTTTRGKEVPVGSGGALTYRFVPVPRRLHGIWKGVPLNECVGGNCKSLDSLTPERWATIALAGSQLHHVERITNGEAGAESDYLGFVHTVPVGTPQDGVVGSLEIGAPVLRQKAIVPGAHGNEVSTVFAQWLPLALAHKPAEWKGLALGSSDTINNAGVLPTARASAAYVFARTIGNGREMTQVDPMAAALTNVIERKGHARTYGGRMITELTVAQSGPIYLLDAPTPDGELFSQARVFAAIAADPTVLCRVLDAYRNHQFVPSDPKLLGLAVAALSSSEWTVSQAAENFLKTVRPSAVAASRALGVALADQIAKGNRRAADFLRHSDIRDEALALDIWRLMHHHDPATAKLAWELRALVDPVFPAVADQLLRALRGTPPSAAAATILVSHGQANRTTTEVLASVLPLTRPGVDSAASPSRETVIEALGEPGGDAERAGKALEGIFSAESHGRTRGQILAAMRKFGATPPLEFLIAATKDEDSVVRPRALAMLADTGSGDPRLLAALESALDSPSNDTRGAALEAAWRMRLRSPRLAAGAAAQLNQYALTEGIYAAVYAHDVLGHADARNWVDRFQYLVSSSADGRDAIMGRATYLDYTLNDRVPSTPSLYLMAKWAASSPEAFDALVDKMVKDGVTNWSLLWRLNQSTNRGDPEAIALRNEVFALVRRRLGADWRFVENPEAEVAKLTHRDAKKIRALLERGVKDTPLGAALRTLLCGFTAF